MTKRIISGLIGIGLFLGGCFAEPLAFAFAVTLLTGFSLLEWNRAYCAAQPATPKRRVMIAFNTLAAALGIAYTPFAHFYLPTARGQIIFYSLILAGFVLLFTARVFAANKTGEALGRGRYIYGAIGMVYLGALFSSLVLLRDLPGRISVHPFGFADRGAWLLLFVTACVWATDTCAYFAGRSFGKRKLAPKLSPGKTVEGFFGGLFGAMLTGAIFAAWIHLSPALGLAVGAMAGVVGPLGDLFESALKRELGLKDFGRIMPGHGGILDRFDSLLFVAPLAYLMLILGFYFTGYIGR